MILQIAVLIAAVPATPCSFSFHPSLPYPEMTVILAVARTDVRAVSRDIDMPVSDREAPIDALRFDVVDVAGGDGALGAGDRFFAVPWAYDDQCVFHPAPTSDWVSPGDTVLFNADFGLRQSEGHKVLDALWAHQPYPEARGLASQAGYSDVAPDLPWVGPSELFRLLGRLSAGEDALSPAIRRRFPANLITPTG